MLTIILYITALLALIPITWSIAGLEGRIDAKNSLLKNIEHSLSFTLRAVGVLLISGLVMGFFLTPIWYVINYKWWFVVLVYAIFLGDVYWINFELSYNKEKGMSRLYLSEKVPLDRLRLKYLGEKNSYRLKIFLVVTAPYIVINEIVKLYPYIIKYYE